MLISSTDFPTGMLADCWGSGEERSTIRAAQRQGEDALTRAIIIQLASQYGRYGYRRITALLRDLGWELGKDRAQGIWRREGLKVPQKQRPRGRLWRGKRQ
jgi:hypothetical protein